jgi:hypothetical protein
MLSMVVHASAENEICPHQKGWSISDEKLRLVLDGHRRWETKWNEQYWDEEWARKNQDGRAILCNADLKGKNLAHADLRGVDLRGSDLSDADFTAAELSSAELDGAKLHDAKFNSANLTSASMKEIFAVGTDMSGADLFDAKLNGSDLGNVILNKAILVGANLSDARFFRCELNGANLTNARLNNVMFAGVDLRNATLRHVQVAGAQFSFMDLTNATYAPVFAPPSYVSSLTGLSAVKIPEGNEIGLLQIRDLLQKNGLRAQEREATYAIEAARTTIAIMNWKDDVGAAFEGIFRTVAFDWTTAYGLYPRRALLLIVGLWFIAIPIYAWPIARRQDGPSSIYRVWPKDRLAVSSDERLVLADKSCVERLQASWLRSLGWSAYFSLLATFYIGFRDFNIGNWLSRIQSRSFFLESSGWVRSISGLQSLLSLYFLAIWVLTYFGRPFQ